MTVEFFVAKAHRYTQARRFLRLPADLPVQVMAEELRVNDRVLDISEAGIGVRTDRPLAPMALVSLRLELPHDSQPIDLLGRVMWRSRDHMGIRFEQKDPRLGDLLFRLRQNYARI
ncbi:MAG: PilZ domain-containing protein [Archangium sp.]